MQTENSRKNEDFNNHSNAGNPVGAAKRFLNIQENISLKDYTTMKIGGVSKKFATANNEKEILEICTAAKLSGEKIFSLGGGSNTVFSEKTHDLLILLLKNKGIIKTYENSEMVNIEVQAGEGWDDLVNWTTENNYSGLEKLSGIPGTVGAGPIQNIGAYGSEIKDTLTKVRILDLESGKIFEIPNVDCEFSYRDSVFKRNLGKFIILSVSFSLSKVATELEIPTYKDVQMHFLKKDKKKVTSKEIREAILEIRNNKIPLHQITPNCGSFFKNPIVGNHVATQIGLEKEALPYTKINDNEVKLFAGWLIENSGYKGYDFGTLKIDDKNSLIITNPDSIASYNDLKKAVAEIQEKVLANFGVNLEVEPNLID